MLLLKRIRIKREIDIGLSKTNKLEGYAQIVSHDLKSPLRSINSLIRGLKRMQNNLRHKQNYFSLIEHKGKNGSFKRAFNLFKN
jgi:light-regulated signal transduction histidine kinase (bacteriophytochrome)